MNLLQSLQSIKLPHLHSLPSAGTPPVSGSRASCADVRSCTPAASAECNQFCHPVQLYAATRCKVMLPSSASFRGVRCGLPTTRELSCLAVRIDTQLQPLLRRACLSGTTLCELVLKKESCVTGEPLGKRKRGLANE